MIRKISIALLSFTVIACSTTPIQEADIAPNQDVVHSAAVIPAAGQKEPKANATPEFNVRSFYTKSYALLIGNSDYQHWDKLDSTQAETDNLKKMLIQQGFEVVTAPSRNLKSDELRQTIRNFLIEKGASPDNRLLVFFSGHGHTAKTSQYENLSYIVPIEAPNPKLDETGFKQAALEMGEVARWTKQSKSKHILFLFDSCFSGGIFHVKGNVSEHEQRIQDWAKKQVRYAITAGDVDEKVPGKSKFVPLLIRGIEQGEADNTGDGYITGSELADYLRARISKQTNDKNRPQGGEFEDSEGGQFIFITENAKVPLSSSSAKKISSDAIQRELDIYAEEMDRDFDFFKKENLESKFDKRTEERCKEKETFFQESANQGYAAAHYLLGRCFSNKKNYAQALVSFQQAAEKGYADAQFKLVVMYKYGQGVEKDEKKALDWLSKATETTAREGEARCQGLLGYMYLFGWGVEKNQKQALSWLQKSAEQGDDTGQQLLGFAYLYGSTGIKKDYKQALYWTQKAAEQGNSGAWHVLGSMYLGGMGVEQDYKQALYWTRKSAEQGNHFGQQTLALMYSQGWGVEKDEKQAFIWNQKSAEQGNFGAQLALGKMYFAGKVVQKDNEKALFWTHKAAEQGQGYSELATMYLELKDYQQALFWTHKGVDQGDADSQSVLGFMYLKGWGVEKDEKQALLWTRKSAEQGSGLGQNNLGIFYENGWGIEKDEKQAFDWILKAANQKYSKAQYSLGDMYFYGNGVTQDYQQALNWYRKSAEQGFVDAQATLGGIYLKGLGVQKDEKQALVWTRKAVEKGNDLGQVNLSLMYLYGWGVEKDEKQALFWANKAVEQKSSIGQVNLGYMYLKGLGVEKDEKQALFWFRKSAAQGDKRAKEMVAELEAKGIR